MTGDQLKRWRENRNLSQQQLADYLGDPWTRDMVANREANRATMPENVQFKLEQVDAIISRAASTSGAPAKPKRDYSKHQCWDLAGGPITMQHVQTQPKGFQFYRLDSSKHWAWPLPRLGS